VCFGCGKPGHFIAQCPNPHKTQLKIAETHAAEAAAEDMNDDGVEQEANNLEAGSSATPMKRQRITFAAINKSHERPPRFPPTSDLSSHTCALSSAPSPDALSKKERETIVMDIMSENHW
jgi:hypothetical protein